ncbi:ATP-binding protein [Gimesia sp.]|uniref:ATP-binding protein n=1 Tax=Gimesia sp. TaxID=2024833 RepID=UPI003447F442
MGHVPASKLGSELLFDVISTAYEHFSLIVTANLPFENWIEVLGSERLTGATLDRHYNFQLVQIKAGSRKVSIQT